MDKKSFTQYVEKFFSYNTLPTLMNFVRIPNLSPAYDPEWNTNGLQLKAANLITSFAKALNLKNCEINIIQDKGYTPVIFIEIAASRENDNRTVLFYAHFDKQPHGTGWDPDKGPTNPVIIDGHLYGRGSVDDGYASFSILTAIKACQDHNCPMPRVCCIFEGAEESTDEHLTYYFNKLINVLGQNVVAFIPLDSGCSTYDRMWLTSSLRGCIDFNINVQTLEDDFKHGADANGRVVENFFVVRKIIDSIMDNTTGNIKIDEFHLSEIPSDKLEQLEKEVLLVGDKFFDDIPIYEGVDPLKKDVKEAMINNRWEPTFTLLGIDNCPEIKDNGFLAKKSMNVKVSMRIPPGIDVNKALEALNTTVKENTYLNAKVDCNVKTDNVAEGWELKNFSDRMKEILNNGSKEFFGNELYFRGEGGSIPFITYFQTKYPNCDIICTGVCGADGNEHSPNESLNIDAAKKMILVLCYMLTEI